MISLLILIILGLSLILNLSLGFFVLFKNTKNVINATFFLFVIGIVGWGTSILILLLYGANIIVTRFTFSFAAIMLASFLLFSIAFPNSKKNKLFYPIIFLIATFFILPLIGNFIVKSVAVTGNFITIDFGSLYWLYIIFAPFCIISSLIILIKKYVKSKSIQRLQLKYLFLGGLLFLIPAVMTNLLLPTFFNIWQYNGLGPSFSFFMIAAIAYAIIRYHLMDIWIIIRKGTIFALLFGVIAFIFVFLSSLIERYVSESVKYIIPAFIVTIGFIPLKNLIELATDKIFFRKRYKFTKVISDIEIVIRQSGLDLYSLLEGLHHAIKDSLRVKKAAILILIPTGNFISRHVIDGTITELNLKSDSQIALHLKSCDKNILDKEDLKSGIHQESAMTPEAKNQIIKEIEQLDFTIAVPIKSNGKLIGIYLVGEKLSQDPFTQEDIYLLEHITSEMAFAIENARMYEELKKLDQTKSEFISVASHQLRTPLSIIKWDLELFSDKDTPQDQKNELLKTVSKSVVSMGDQLNKLMIALEIEEKKNIFLDKKSAYLKKLILECLDKYKEALKEKNISYETIFSETLPSTICDLKKIKMSLDTLIQNAITYTPNEGKIKIEGKTKKIDNKDCFVISISDNGIGINDKDQENIFKKFFRSKEARTISPNGFGLDLFIAKKYIEAHGGNLWFNPNADKRGTTFYFSIPL